MRADLSGVTISRLPVFLRACRHSSCILELAKSRARRQLREVQRL